MLAYALQVAQQRIRKLDDSREEATMRAELAGDIKALLQRAATDAHRDSARLQEQLVQLRLERGKLQREEVMLREKVGPRWLVLRTCLPAVV